MKQKPHFFGKYYKFLSKTNYPFVVIVAKCNEDAHIQIIDQLKSYVITDQASVTVKDKSISFNVVQDDLILNGDLYFDSLHPLKKDVMGALRICNLECKHTIYSMYHNANGRIEINGRYIDFSDGVGYIEGDEGKSFPLSYIWYNSIGKDYGLSFAIATIPLGFKCILGSFIVYKDEEHEIVFSTLSRLKIIDITDNQIILRKGKYQFIIQVPKSKGHKLYAPKNGNMCTVIMEAVDAISSFAIYKGKTLLIRKDDVHSSLERVGM